ncbi:MAG: hypothetical protein HIU57_03540 [Acidobacteria bacterium]|nr:hypothetical protein [Acidobacteriota bacterium]
MTIHNAAAHITRAYNRPAPPRPVTVWHTDAHAQYLRHGRQVLRAYDHHGGLTHYVD